MHCQAILFNRHFVRNKMCGVSLGEKKKKITLKAAVEKEFKN